MANIVQQIYDSITTLTEAELPSFKKMRRVFAPNENDFRSAKNSFGVIHKSASDAAGVTKVYTLDHSFEVLLMSTFVSGNDDLDKQTVINSLYDAADELLKLFFLSKLGLPGLVLLVSNPAIAEPEILNNEAVVLRVSFDVKYRNAIDS